MTEYIDYQDVLNKFKQGIISKKEASKLVFNLLHQKNQQEESISHSFNAIDLLDQEEEIHDNMDIDELEDPIESDFIENIPEPIETIDNSEIEDVLSHNQSTISKEERHLLITKLVEKKKIDSKLDKENEYYDSNDYNRSFSDSSRPQSMRYSSTKRNSKSFDESTFQLRSNRTMKNEESVRREMFSEFTFRPNIKELPETYGPLKNQDVPFYQRVTKWQNDNITATQRKRMQKIQTETQDCSFHPTINKNSSRAMRELRQEEEETATERLYRNAFEIAHERHRVIEHEKRLAEEIISEVCTFKPTVKSLTKYPDIMPKYNQPLKRQQHPIDAVILPSREMKECTFTPKVKGVRPHMSSAKLYLSANVVDRLTRPIETILTEHVSFDDSHVTGGVSRSLDDSSFAKPQYLFDANSFISGQSHGYDKPRPKSAPKERSSSRKSTSYSLDQEHFESFLMRQQLLVDQKNRKIHEKLNNLTPSFHPEINQKSIAIISKNSRGTFYDRLQKDVISRKDRDSQDKYSKVSNNLSFTPQINRKSQRLQGRSCYEMSRGDLLRKETNSRMRRLQMEQEQLNELTFQPELSKKAQYQSKSILKTVLEGEPIMNPKNRSSSDGSIITSQFIDWVKDQQRRKDEKCNLIQSQKIEKELSECTFQPKPAAKCPNYVTRIAKSMAIVKAARNNNREEVLKVKPDWR